MVGVDTLRRSVASRPRGRAPIGFPNWDEQSQVVRNDAGELASLKKVLLERRQQRKAEKRRAKQLARAMGVISAEATRARPLPVHPHCTLRSLSISVPPSCADDRGGFILDEAPPINLKRATSWTRQRCATSTPISAASDGETWLGAQAGVGGPSMLTRAASKSSRRALLQARQRRDVGGRSTRSASKSWQSAQRGARRGRRSSGV